jgi:hypothetical protein
MALWKRGRRYWTYFSVNGEQLRRPLCPPGSTLATTNWQEATRLEKEMIRAALERELAPRDPSIKLFAAIDDYLEAKKATANSKRTIEFDRERLAIVKRHFGDVKLATITRTAIERFQAKRRLDGASNRTINMDVGALRQVLRRFKQWRRLEDDVKMLRHQVEQQEELRGAFLKLLTDLSARQVPEALHLRDRVSTVLGSI